LSEEEYIILSISKEEEESLGKVFMLDNAFF